MKENILSQKTLLSLMNYGIQALAQEHENQLIEKNQRYGKN